MKILALEIKVRIRPSHASREDSGNAIKVNNDNGVIHN